MTTPDPALQLIAEGITELVGFGVSLINLVRGDEFEVVAVAGSMSGHTVSGAVQDSQELLGMRWPVSDLDAELANAEDWGLFKFVPAERSGPNLSDGVWIPDLEPSDGPDAWQAYDLLVAPILDEGGSLRGLLSIDRPVDGRRPDQARRRILERFAEQTRAAVLLTLERERLAERARDLELARTILRSTTGAHDVEQVLATVRATLARALAADTLWLRAHGPGGQDIVVHTPGVRWTGTRAAVEEADRAAELTWAQSSSLRVDRQRLDDLPDQILERETLAAFLDTCEARWLLFVPLGVEEEALGFMMLLRQPDHPPWTAADGRLARELGRDLGQLILRSNAYSRERDLAEQLRSADQERSRLIEAVVGELNRPLDELDVALADLRRSQRDSEPWHNGLNRLGASAGRLVATVDNLLLLSRLSDPATPLPEEHVDLAQLLDDICHAEASNADAHGIQIAVELPPAALVCGERRELESAITHLVTNAIAYSPVGGRVVMELASEGGEVVVAVSDTGIGIPAAEQEKVFAEFVRGSHPLVQRTPGAGLGLTIARRIAERHGGRIEVESGDAGSTFRLILPTLSPTSGPDRPLTSPDRP